VLLLNKCDLLPAAAAAAWQQWLQQQLPGVTVIPVSAAKEQAAATAQAVLAAVLQQRVLRGGQRVQVQELLGLSLGKLSRQGSVLQLLHWVHLALMTASPSATLTLACEQMGMLSPTHSRASVHLPQGLPQ
jgi:hypothetical protein